MNHEEDARARSAVPQPLSRASIREHRKRIGMAFDSADRNRGPSQVAHWDNISLFAENVGDPNPLWHDEEYAAASCYGRVVAPPGFLLSVWPGAIVQGLPGALAAPGGGAYEFYKPVLDGDEISVQCTFAAVVEKSSQFSPLWLVEYYDNRYFNQGRELVAKVRAGVLRWNLSDVRDGFRRTAGAGPLLLPHPWTEEEVARIEEDVLSEVDSIRGGTPRYWEDVGVGEILPELVRGPRRLFDAVAESVAVSVWGGGPTGLAALPGDASCSWIHPETKGREDTAIATFDRLTAEHLGFPHCPDNGLVRQCHAMEAIIDWMGDDAWLKAFSAQNRRMVYISDVVRVKSEVTRKYVNDDGEHCVDIDQHMVNQRGEDVMPSSAAVALPSRERVLSPVASRLPVHTV